MEFYFCRKCKINLKDNEYHKIVTNILPIHLLGRLLSQIKKNCHLRQYGEQQACFVQMTVYQRTRFFLNTIVSLNKDI